MKKIIFYLLFTALPVIFHAGTKDSDLRRHNNSSYQVTRHVTIQENINQNNNDNRTKITRIIIEPVKRSLRDDIECCCLDWAQLIRFSMLACGLVALGFHYGIQYERSTTSTNR